MKKEKIDTLIKTPQNLLIWLTLSLTIFYFSTQKIRQSKENNNKKALIEEAKKNTYKELNNNNIVLRTKILGAWNRFYANFYQNYEKVIISLSENKLEESPLSPDYILKLKNDYQFFWEINEGYLWLSNYSNYNLHAYKQQNLFKKSYTQFFNAYLDLATSLMKGKNIGENHPKYKTFLERIDEVNNHVATLPNNYHFTLNSLINRGLLEEKKNLEKIDSCPAPYIFELMQNYVGRSNTKTDPKDSLTSKIKNALEIYFNKKLLAIYKKELKEKNLTKEDIKIWINDVGISFKNNKFYTEKKGNKILFLADMPGLAIIGNAEKKEVYKIVENILKRSTIKKNMEHYIGIFSGSQPVLLGNPWEQDTSGIYADPQILCEFFTNPQD